MVQDSLEKRCKKHMAVGVGRGSALRATAGGGGEARRGWCVHVYSVLRTYVCSWSQFMQTRVWMCGVGDFHQLFKECDPSSVRATETDS